MKSLSFDDMAELYDETRIFDKKCFDAALDFLVERFPPQVFNKVFEPGIGTGRIAIPLAERGYHVTGIDISADMLTVLERRLIEYRRPLGISFKKADVTELPFQDAAFDMAIAVHLFYFTKEWQKAAKEILRVVKNGGPIALMSTGRGTEIPFLNDRYKELCAEQGYKIEQVGVKSTKEVVDYYEAAGCHVEWVRNRWQWTSHIRLDKALYYVKTRAYSFTTLVPEDVHTTTVVRLESELAHRFDDLTTEIGIPNEIYIVIILRY